MHYALASRTNAPVLRTANSVGAGVVRLLLTCGTRAVVSVPACLLDAFEDVLATLAEGDYAITLTVIGDGYAVHAVDGCEIRIADGATTYTRPIPAKVFAPRQRARKTRKAA